MGLLTGVEVKGAKVIVVWLWTFGNDVGGGDLVVVGVVLGMKLMERYREGQKERRNFCESYFN